jgi:ribonucleoside-diphosphate reductase alpha chain
MRVAMGLALNEIDREARAIEFYEVLSSFDFMSSTPTLFNSGTLRSQLSSCYLTTVPDDLDGIYESIKENALLSKFAGGLGNDWTRVRALGSHIKGTNGESQGVVPFLKVVNDTAVAVNQGGKRKGAVCTYLETWHLDIEEFLELRKNTGDDRRRTHDMNTANWIPDLFMRRVMEKGTWTLFSPSQRARPARPVWRRLREGLCRLRRKGRRGEIKPSQDGAGHRPVAQDAVHAVRDRPPLDHVQGRLQRALAPAARRRGALVQPVHRNHAEHQRHRNRRLQPGLGQSAAAPEGRQGRPRQAQEDHHHRHAHAGQRDRHQLLRRQEGARLQPAPPPGGPGHDGLPGRLYELRIPYASQEAVQFADESMEAICYHAYWASTELARSAANTPATRARCGTRASCRWTRWTCWPRPAAAMWKWTARPRWTGTPCARRLPADGMRNSNCVAIAPTATISNIIGVDASIEPCFGNLSVKSNLSGEFTVINHYLVRDLKRLGLWDDVMVMDLKHFDGSLRPIDRVPQDIKALYATAFEVETSGWWKPPRAARSGSTRRRA